ncbi:hypothetical protein GTP58_22320 [Duganella sp. CY15W]|uniref:hypothetical protein n=1 Tax=Duganella sp. CY15W TaxID=2692172 RepID=UPI001369D7DE|nr:hypothetical protein [Duganella sp. CY15W]MYM31079.1 hypothetical protein [Duganella sp. CY15W]
MIKSAFLLTALLSSIANAASFDPEVNLAKVEQEAQRLRTQLRNPALASDKVKITLNSKLQQLGNQRSFVGDSDGAMAAFDETETLHERRNAAADAGESARLEAAKAEDAISAIVREAANHRIVILNEAHHVPLHRAFAMRLARELRKLGYTWLACETFENTPLRKGYLALSDGYYSREPAFGNFLRDAAADGWKLVQYEPFDEITGETDAQQIDQRDSGEARNLVKRIFDQDPNAKAFIYVGYSHAQKVPRVGDSGGGAWMAAQLSHMTGLEPLTIDQTIMMEHVDQAAEYPLYAAAVGGAGQTTPIVLRAPDGRYEVFGRYRLSMDMQVIHPRYGTDADTGRPTWLRTVAGFQPAEIPQKMRRPAKPYFVYAYPKNQPKDAVPADIVQITPGKPLPKLMLPDAQFRFAIRQ